MTTNIEFFEPDADRYVFDFKFCTYDLGWCQVDTEQDASYYGTWANPTKRHILTFAEGDVKLTKCGTDEEFSDEMRGMAEWHLERGYWRGIDPGINETGATMREHWGRLGLSELLH